LALVDLKIVEEIVHPLGAQPVATKTLARFMRPVKVKKSVKRP